MYDCGWYLWPPVLAGREGRARRVAVVVWSSVVLGNTWEMGLVRVAGVTSNGVAQFDARHPRKDTTIGRQSLFDGPLA